MIVDGRFVIQLTEAVFSFSNLDMFTSFWMLFRILFDVLDWAYSDYPITRLVYLFNQFVGHFLPSMPL